MTVSELKVRRKLIVRRVMAQRMSLAQRLRWARKRAELELPSDEEDGREDQILAELPDNWLS